MRALPLLYILFGICSAQYAALIGYKSPSCKGAQVYVNYSPQCNLGVKSFCSAGEVNITYYSDPLCTSYTFSMKWRDGTCINTEFGSFEFICTSGPVEIDAEKDAQVYTINGYSSDSCGDSELTGITQYVTNVCVDGIYVTCNDTSAQMMDYQDQACAGLLSQSSNALGTCSLLSNALSPTPVYATTTCAASMNGVMLVLIGFFILLCL